MKFLIRRMVRDLRIRLRRAEHDPRIVRDVVERRFRAAESSEDPDQSPAVQRAEQVLRDAYERRRKVRRLFPAFLPPWRLRERAARCRTAALGSECGGSSVEAAGGLLAAAVLAGVVVLAASSTDRKMVEQAGNVIPVPTQSISAHDSPNRSGAPASRPSVNLGTSRSLGTTISAPMVRSDVPAAKADINVGVDRQRRIVVEDKLGGSLDSFGVHVASGEILWFDCDPASAVRQAVCRAYDTIPQAGG